MIKIEGEGEEGEIGIEREIVDKKWRESDSDKWSRGWTIREVGRSESGLVVVQRPIGDEGSRLRSIRKSLRAFISATIEYFALKLRKIKYIVIYNSKIALPSYTVRDRYYYNNMNFH